MDTSMNIKKFIVPRTLENTNEKKKNGDKKFRTQDLIFIDADIKNCSVCYPTDYAIMNGAMMSTLKDGPEDRKSCWAWLRAASSYYLLGKPNVHCVGMYGCKYPSAVDETDGTIRPCLQLNIVSILLAQEKSSDNFKIDEYKIGGKVKYHTIEFGEYPKTYVGDSLNMYLEDEMSKGTLVATGRKYTGHFDDRRNPSYNEEYMLYGKRFVRVLSVFRDVDSEFLDGTKAPADGTPLWVKVEPITWVIRNWDDMPKEINPEGSGKAIVMNIQTQEAIISGIPFYPNGSDKNCSMWQNSTIRGYLNGYNVNNITFNGNEKYTAPNGGDFRERNFISEALSNVSALLSKQSSENSKVAEEVINQVVKKKERKGYGIKVLDKPMTVNEQIKFYIENGKSFMLHGPSGVGKTRRIEEADPDFVSIVLRNGILPEEVIGKTIYPNNDKTKSGIWVPPAWYTQLCEKCKQEPNKQHILFIDEITNVKPSEQSLVFHLILNNSIGPNVGKLPQNVVVAAAGNSKEESEAAYNMPEPLFRRFDGHIELKPDVLTWLEWGSEKSNKGESRLKVHPLVASFVGAYGNQVFYSPYDSEDPPKYAIDPRGWEQISDIIYDNKGLIVRELIENKVGKEIATAFLGFAKTPLLCIDDILNKNYTPKDIPTGFDARYALALSLRQASIDEIQEVREFIGRELGREILSMFDSVWVGDDNEKAIHLANLQNLKRLGKSEDLQKSTNERKEFDDLSPYANIY